MNPTMHRLLAFCMLLVLCACEGMPTPDSPSSMTIRSPAFTQNEAIPAEYSCDGRNVSPPLQITDIPVRSKSLALIVEDPDAPGGNFIHWIVWNIPPVSTVWAAGGVPAVAVQGINDFGTMQYGGPCPPLGEEHQYVFRLFALSRMLNLDNTANDTALHKAMDGVILEESTLTGRYSRAE